MSERMIPIVKEKIQRMAYELSIGEFPQDVTIKRMNEYLDDLYHQLDPYEIADYCVVVHPDTGELLAVHVKFEDWSDFESVM